MRLMLQHRDRLLDGRACRLLVWTRIWPSRSMRQTYIRRGRRSIPQLNRVVEVKYFTRTFLSGVTRLRLTNGFAGKCFWHIHSTN